MMTSHDTTIIMVLVSLFAALHPEAAIGASFGCMFFVAFKNADTLMQKLFYTGASWGGGYSVGLATDGVTSMLSAFLAACFTIAVVSSIARSVDEGDLPEWLSKLIRLWRGIK